MEIIAFIIIVVGGWWIYRANSSKKVETKTSTAVEAAPIVEEAKAVSVAEAAQPAPAKPAKKTAAKKAPAKTAAKKTAKPKAK